MLTKMQPRFTSYLLTALVGGALLLSACAQAVDTTALPNPTTTAAPLATSEPTVITAPTATAAPEATAVATKDTSFHFTLDTGSIAAGFQSETVADASTSDQAAYWQVLPEYTRVDLEGYPISSHTWKPQIFIYPVDELAKVNENAAKVVAELQSLLKSPQETPEMPFLPLVNAKQGIHAQVQYLDFKSGKGVRFLTWYSQGIVPVNNNELIYTYQGLTSDGKYYVAAVLPVNHPSLPADGKVTGNEPPEFSSDYLAYLGNVVKTLNPQAAATFTPDLTQLDAMLSSLEIK